MNRIVCNAFLRFPEASCKTKTHVNNFVCYSDIIRLSQFGQPRNDVCFRSCDNININSYDGKGLC